MNLDQEFMSIEKARKVKKLTIEETFIQQEEE